MNASFWQNRKVLVTGHTGFMGGWLTLNLHRLGAKVTGLALAPDTDPNFFTATDLHKLCDSHLLDINNYAAVAQLVSESRPEVIFHLAAQPLVLPSYDQPLNTFSTNVMGVAHILEANRQLAQPAPVTLIVTSDKCYENRESGQAYKESDPMGGFDPYSASKGAAEIVCSAYRRSYYVDRDLCLTSVRAGNIVGGGDWAKYRIFPDIAVSLSQKRKVVIRSPESVRPWQHVLDPVTAYIELVEKAWDNRNKFSRPYNIGPDPENEKSVLDLVSLACKAWGLPDHFEIQRPVGAKKEAKLLHIDSSAIKADLGWRPRYSFEDTVRMTVDWYKDFYSRARG